MKKSATITLYTKAWNLIDAEFEVLQGMDKNDLWDYLSNAIPTMKREESDKLWTTIFGAP